MIEIALISYKYPPVYSGYGNQAQAVIKEIGKQNKNIRFTVLTWNFGKKANENENVSVKRLGSPYLKNSSYINSILFGFYLFKWLILNRSRYDLIHCLGAKTYTALAIIASKITGKIILVKITQNEMDSNIKTNPIKSIFRKARQLIMALADKLIVISDDIQHQLVSSGIKIEKFAKIPNGVNTDVFSPPASQEENRDVRVKLGVPEDRVVILFSGALGYRKGISDLIAALKNDYFEEAVMLLICGPDHGYGVTLSEEVKYISNRNNNLKIRYDGVVTNMSDYLKASDIFVMPSYFEGLPNALLEAAASGLALVVSNIGGNRDIVQHEESGLLFDPGDHIALSEKIKELIYDKSKRDRLSKNALKRACNDYSLQGIADQYIELYLSVLSKSER